MKIIVPVLVSILIWAAPAMAAPIISNAGPTGAIDYEVDEDGTQSNRVHLSVATSNDADCRYSTSAGQAYSSMTDFENDMGYCADSDGQDGNGALNEDKTFCTSDAQCPGTCLRTSHYQALSGLPEGGHTYYVKCHDGTSASPTDQVVSFTLDDASSDFDDRCNQPGVVLCLGFDYEAALLDPTNKSYVEPTDSEADPNSNDGRCTLDDCEQIDQNVRASGSGSLRYEYPASPFTPSTNGFFEHNFTPDSRLCNFPGPCPQSYPMTFGEGQELYVQMRVRVTESMHRMFRRSDGGTQGWKVSIIGAGDSANAYQNSCTGHEAVTLLDKHGGPWLYHSCGLSGSHNSQGHANGNSCGVTYQDFSCCCATGVPSGCQSGGGIPGPGTDDICESEGKSCDGCLSFEPDEWLTITHRIKIGTYASGLSDHSSDPDSLWQVWLAPEGGPSVLFFDTNGPYHGGWHWHREKPNASCSSAGSPYSCCTGSGSGTCPDADFGKIWLMPQISFKDGSETHEQAFFWYDDLIVSSLPIADPGSGPPVTDPPSAPTNLQAE